MQSQLEAEATKAVVDTVAHTATNGLGGSIQPKSEEEIEDSKGRMNKMDEDYKADKEELDRQQEIEKINLNVKIKSRENEEGQKRQQWKFDEERMKQKYEEALEKQRMEAAINLAILQGKYEESLDRLKEEYEKEKQSIEIRKLEEQAMIQAELEQFLKTQIALLEQENEMKRREAEEQQISLAQSLSVNEWINSAIAHVSNVSNYINVEDYSTALTKMESASQAVSALTQHSYLAKAELTSREHFMKKVNAANRILFEIQAKLSQFSVKKPSEFVFSNTRNQMEEVKEILLKLSSKSRSLFSTSSEMQSIGY